MASSENTQAESEAIWYGTLTHGHRTRMAIFPGRPRCTVCPNRPGGLRGENCQSHGPTALAKEPADV